MPGPLPGGVRAVVLDVDGTLIHGDAPAEGGYPLPGAAALLRWLRRRGLPYLCFTNGSTRPPEVYASGLRELGLEVGDDQVMTPSVVAAGLVLRRWPGATVLALGGAGVTEPLRRRGIEVTTEVGRWREARVVLVGWDREIDYPRLEAACRAVSAGAAFLVTSTAPRPYLRGGAGIGLSAAIAAAVARVTGRRPHLVGKPSPLALHESARALGVRPGQLAVVGDDVDTDVRMGRRGAGLTVLVRTGTSAGRDLGKGPERLQPDLDLPDLTHLPALLDAPRARAG
ncbi:MAG TPA: HAD-IIA family hydrolase [Candidatus Dormibacteraeota bacterium]|nr:HAD-IIA family hydrolase [Candidatus Dormibacteraeota bacterium]